jgi:hypothetical protein
MRSGQRQTNPDYWGQFNSDQMVLGLSGKEAGLHEQWSKTLNEPLKLKGDY